MRIVKLLIPTFVICVRAAAEEAQQSNGAVTATSSISGTIAPARTMDSTTEYTSTRDPDLDPSAGDDENGPPDAEDDSWVNAFLDGEPLDPLLDFDTHDLIDNEDCDDCGDEEVNNGAISATKNTSIITLTKQRSLSALAQAHYRARRRTAGLSYTGSAEPEDQQWAATFFSGADVDHDLIWNAADLDDPADNPTNDVALLSAADFNSWTAEAAAMAASTNSTDTNPAGSAPLEKRIQYKHPPRNALQVLRRYQRAARRARHRARVRRHRAAVRRIKRKAHAVKVHLNHWQKGMHKAAKQQHEAKVRQHKAKVNEQKAGNRIMHQIPQYPDATHKANGKLRHGVKKCGHRTAPGTLCDGSINCHWWCVRGVQNCGFDSAC